MPVAWGFFLLLLGCASLRREDAPREGFLPGAGYEALARRVGSTEEGRKLLEGARHPIEVFYGTPEGLVGSQGDIEDERNRVVKHIIAVHENLKSLPPSDLLLAIVFSHELTHIAQSGYPPEKKALVYYGEAEAYAAAMRVWIELDPESRLPLARGLVKDFEGRDVAETLGMLRNIYERSLEEFVDAIELRYKRLCRFQNKSTPEGPSVCGNYIPLEKNLQASRDPFTKRGWELLQAEDAPFRSKRLEGRRG